MPTRITGGLGLLSFNLAYYFAPNLKDQNWKWLTPGAIAGVLLWLLISFAFRGYLRFFLRHEGTQRRERSVHHPEVRHFRDPLTRIRIATHG